ncbi:MAG: NAD(P)/FAD-dependent oxidoreductase [Rhodospirillales bacterium]
MTIHETDVAIIGAGPVGLFAVFECGMVRVKCHVIDALGDIGGQCTALYPEKPIYDIPGFPAIDAADLIANLETQAAPFAPVYHLGQQVTGLEQTDRGFRLTTSAGTVIAATAVILAAGVGAFGPNRPPMAGIEAYEGGAVQYHVRRRADFAGRRVVIAGGGDSAVDWAISLAEVAEKIYVVHRRDKFRAAPETVERMRALAEPGGKVELVIPYQLHGLQGDGKTLTGVTVRTLDGDERLLEADSLLPFFGLSTELGPIAGWGFEMERKLIATDPATSATSIPGIFAIGDIATYPGKLKLILCGFSEAAMAAHAIYPLVHPDEVLHFEYSTTKGVPGAA